MALRPDVKEFSSGVTALVPHPSDPDLVFAGFQDGRIEMINVATKTMVASDMGRLAELISGSVRSLAVSDDGKLVAASVGNSFAIFEISGKLLKPIDHEGVSGAWITAMAFHPDNRRLGIASGAVPIGGKPGAGTVYVRDVMSKSWLTPFSGKHSDMVTALAWSPDGKYLVTGSGKEDKSLQLWDARRNLPVGSPAGEHIDQINSIAWNEDNRIVVGSKDFTASAYTFDPGTEGLTSVRGEKFQAHTAVSTVAFGLGGKIVAVIGQKNRVKLVGLGARIFSEEHTLNGDGDNFTSGGFMFGGHKVVAGSMREGGRGAITVWDLSPAVAARSESRIAPEVLVSDKTPASSGSMDSSFSVRMTSLALAPSGAVFRARINPGVLTAVRQEFLRDSAGLREELLSQVDQAQCIAEQNVFKALDRDDSKSQNRSFSLGIVLSGKAGEALNDLFLEGFQQGLDGALVKEVLSDGARFPQRRLLALKKLGISVRKLDAGRKMVLRGEEQSVIPLVVMDGQKRSVDLGTFVPLLIDRIESIKGDPESVRWLGKFTARVLVHLADLTEDPKLRADSLKLKAALLGRLHLEDYDELISVTDHGTGAVFGINAVLADVVHSKLVQEAITASA